MEEIMNKFKASMKALNSKELEIVSNNLHKNNVRVDRDITFSHIKQPKYASMRLG